MHLFRPETHGLRPITTFHAMARLGIEGLVIVEPADWFVSLGALDDPLLIDADFCRQAGIAVMRREIGGGTVLLGPNQVFYQLVLQRQRPLVIGRVEDTFARLSEAPLAAYRALGLDVRFRPINDLVTDQGRKISGQGAGEISGHFCYAGNLLIDFDPALMSQVLRTVDVAHEARLHQLLDRELTWLGRERPGVTSAAATEALEHAFARLLGTLTPRTLPKAVLAEAKRLDRELVAQAFDFDDPRPSIATKIREGVYLRVATARIGGRDVRAQVETREHEIHQCQLAGLPVRGLADALRGVRWDPEQVAPVVTALRPALDADDARALTQLITGRYLRD